MNLHFLSPGGTDSFSSYYIYNKRIIDGLKEKGHHIRVHPLTSDFPFPSEHSLLQCQKAIKSIPKGEVVIVDGLIFGAIPAILKEIQDLNPIIAIIHIPLSADPNYSAYQRTMITSLEYEAFGYATKFIASSEYTMEALLNFGIEQKKISLIIPGLDSFPRKKKFPDAPAKLLSIANFRRNKDHTILVKALAALKNMNWVLHCYGNFGPNEENLSNFQEIVNRNQLQNKIFIHGPISDKETSDAYLNADLFVHPSDFETYGFALTEALGHGIPIVASTGGGICRTVPAQMGLFFKPDDVYGLQSILEELFENPGIYKKLYTNVAHYSEQAQSWEKTIDLFEKAIIESN